MNFLNFLTAGASLFNFNLQNMTSSNKNQLPPSQPPKTQIQPSLNSIPQIPELTSTHLNPDVRSELLAQHQQLVNQYMHMNIQLLNKKLQTLEKGAQQEKLKDPKQDKNDEEKEEKKGLKKTKKINKCGHEDKQHYAKGMCNNCYHRYGRTKKPWNCPHEKLYAGGMCQNCYINNYNRKKRQLNQIKEEASEVEPKIEEEDQEMKKSEEE